MTRIEDDAREFVPFTLQGGETAPAYAALEIVEINETVSEVDLYTVKKPTGTTGKTIVFNGPAEVAGGGLGSASNRSHVRGLSGAASGEVGPVNDSWTLSASATEKTHRVVGGVDSGSYILERIFTAAPLGDFGFAQMYADMLTTDNTGIVENYTPIVGSNAPAPEPVTIDNANDLAADTGDTVVVVKVGSSGTVADDWAIAAVLAAELPPLGVCRIDRAYSVADLTTGDFSEFAYYQGSGSAPTVIKNTASLVYVAGDLALINKAGGSWEIIFTWSEGVEENHGMASPYAAFDDEVLTIRPQDYHAVEGSEAPDDTAPSVTNTGLSAGMDDTLVVAKRSGVWTLVHVIEGAESQDTRHGVATLTADLSGSSGTVDTYRPEEGAATPAPTTVTNPAGLSGLTGDEVDITFDDPDWRVVAVRTGDDANHGFAKAYEDFNAATSPVNVTGYEIVEGDETPGASPAPVVNPGLAASAGDLLAVAKKAGQWEVAAIIAAGTDRKFGVSADDTTPGHLDDKFAGGSMMGQPENYGAVAIDYENGGGDETFRLYSPYPRLAAATMAANMAGGPEGDATGTITGVSLLVPGTIGSPPTIANNTFGITAYRSQTVLLRETTLNTWEIVWASLSPLWPCWITSDVAAATESGGDITAQAVTVYLDTPGATAADRVAGAAPVTAYWDDPDNGITIATNKARRGMVAFTAFGTLDVIWANCKARDFTP